MIQRRFPGGLILAVVAVALAVPVVVSRGIPDPAMTVPRRRPEPGPVRTGLAPAVIPSPAVAPAAVEPFRPRPPAAEPVRTDRFATAIEVAVSRRPLPADVPVEEGGRPRVADREAAPPVTLTRRLLRTDFRHPLVVVEELVETRAGAKPRRRGRREYLGGRLIVRVAPGTTRAQLDALARRWGCRVQRRLRIDRYYLVGIDAPGPDSVPELAAAFAGSALVADAGPDFIFHLAVTPNDPGYTDGHLWGMDKIQAPLAWDTSVGSAAVTVAVVDTGVRLTHNDLAANLWVNGDETAGNSVDDDGNGYVDDVNGYDFVNGDADPSDDHNHGTHCAGTIGGVGDNGTGVAGVCWTVRLMGLKVLDSGGSGTTSDIAEAVDYAVDNGADVISLSLSGGGGSSLATAVDEAESAGVILVAAAGNDDGRDLDVLPLYPAAYPNANVVAVANTDVDDELSPSSNVGPTTVDLSAPGTSILSTTAGGDTNYGYMSGTSMATPHVAGGLALLKAAYPDKTATELIGYLLDSVDPLPALDGLCVTGGRMNLAEAMRAAGPAIVADRVNLGVPEGGTADFAVSLNRDPAGPVTVTVAVTAGDPDLSVTGGASLVFTAADWHLPQAVSVSAAEDADTVDGVATVTCSATDWYPRDVRATELDDDPAIAVDHDPLVVPEGGVDHLGVRLDKVPPGPITVTAEILAGGDADLVVAPAVALTFTPADWQRPQPIAVAAQADADATDGTATLQLAGAGLPTRDVSLRERDAAGGHLVAHLPFDETDGTDAIDVTGNGHDGTLERGPTWTDGIIGGALLFDGHNDHLLIGDWNYAPADAWSIAFWFRADDLAGELFQYMLSHGTVGEAHDVNVFLIEGQHPGDPGVLRSVVVDGDDSYDPFALDVTAGPGDGGWHHYAVCVGPGTGTRVYVDGRLAASSPHGGGAFDPATALHLGGREDLDADRFFTGAIDDLRVYGATLASNEVRALAGTRRRVGFTITGVGGVGLADVVIERVLPAGATEAVMLQTREDGHADDDGIDGAGADDDPLPFPEIPADYDQVFGFDPSLIANG